MNGIFEKVKKNLNFTPLTGVRKLYLLSELEVKKIRAQSNKIKEMRRKGFLLVAGVVALLSAAPAAMRADKSSTSRNLRIFNTVYNDLNTFYVDTINGDEAVKTAIRAMLDRVDPYTEYIAADEVEKFTTMQTGQYGGIGSTIMARDGKTYFSEPRLNTPATRAGIKAGDRILAIDGEDVDGMEVDKVSKMLRGEPGTHVRVRLSRPYAGADSIRDLDIVRAKIEQPSVDCDGVIDGVGYIAINQFIQTTPREVEEALERIRRETPDLKGLVIDLRNNGGGLVNSAVKLLGNFLPKGTEVLRTRGRELSTEKRYRTTGKPVLPDLPLVVMVNENTASASEIVSGALQDLDRAVIVGERSFGKGLVQETRNLPYNNMMKITVAKYYLPSGRLVQAIDYSRRNPDGSVARMPDSLRREFKTRGGRTVLDGGGITPDVLLKPDSTTSYLAYQLLKDNVIFDFATRYAATHPELPSPAEFKLTDEIYEQFKAGIDTANFKYELMGRNMLPKLREAVKFDRLLDSAMIAELDALEARMQPQLQRDLDLQRSVIEPFVTAELVQRYYYAPGAARALLQYDNELKQAVQLLQDPEKYKALLKPAKADKKK